MPYLTLITQDLFDQVAAQSRQTPRRRKNYNFHTLDEKVQRFLNVMQPGTYVRPHCHRRPPGVNGFEFFLVLQGCLGFIVFDPKGEIHQSLEISAQGPQYGLELAAETYHTLVVLAPDTIILELKEGPYHPQTDKDFLEQFPPEGSEATAQVMQDWQNLFGK